MGEEGYKAECDWERERAQNDGRRPLASALLALGVLAGMGLVLVIVLVMLGR